MESYGVGGAIKRSKKRNPLDVVPMKMGHQEVQGEFGCGQCAHQVEPKVPQTRTTIDDQDGAIRKAPLHTGCFASEAENLSFCRRYGTAHSPKLHFETKWVADSKSPPAGH